MTPSPESSSVPASVGDRAPRYRYTAALAGEIELRWQREWEERGTFRQPNPGEAGFDASKPKFYCLDMFPYPSGAGLHVGHPEGYTATDMVCRLKRMQGFNVLHPMGWDAFGLPAEQYAIATGVHPAITTKEAIDNFRRQLKRFGFCYDWSREFGTIDPEYYRWTQWIFLRLYGSWFDPRLKQARPISELVSRLEIGELGVDEAGEVVPCARCDGGAMRQAPGVRAWNSLTPDEQRRIVDSKRLAYLGEQTVNWCPKLGTALANDEVIDGKSERGGYPVLRKPLRQWMLRITAYAQRLLDGLQGLDWPSSTRTMQEEWIGRSEGAEIEFAVVGGMGPSTLRVFTTRPDTLFGATYMVVAPEHPLIDEAMARAGDATRRALAEYVAWARNRSDVERQESRDKTGCFTGLFAINPGTGERIPIWTADYVLMGYGFGAIMAVPAHDERDFEFAEKFALPIRDVVYPRQTLAMRFFGLHATPDERRPERFAAVLADFLGWVGSQDVPPEKFAEALATVRTRRAADAPGAVIHTHAGEPMTGRAGESGERRGVVQSTWLDTIEAFGFTTHEALRERFERAALASEGPQRGPYSGAGFSANSAGPELSINALPTSEAKEAVIAWLERSGRGGRKINFRLRDWVFSRQRYWGEPFPIVFDADGRAHPVSESALPVTLPALADYAPVESDEPQPLLAKAKEWTHLTAREAGVTTLPPEAPVVRETNTMPGSAGSSWYFLRYCDARNGGRFASREAEQYWMGGNGTRGGVDLYLGGSEHAVGHLLYSRFWQNVLFDLGEVSTPEPFHKLFHQGLITSYAYQRADKTIVPTDEVREVAENTFEHAPTGERVTPVVTKMSKRYKNVVNPDDVIAEFGADTFRLYEMYMGPLEASKPWNTRDIPGLFRFLARLWRLVIDEESGAPVMGEAADAEIEKLLHRLGAKVEQDIARLAFNTAIAACIEFVNAATSAREKRSARLTPAQARRLALVICPLAPHIAEELWAKAGGTGLASDQRWPEADPGLLRDDDVEIAVQIQGKVRQRLRVPAGADAAAVEALVMADAEVQKHLAGKTVKKVVVVPGRMVNIVAG